MVTVRARVRAFNQDAASGAMTKFTTRLLQPDAEGLATAASMLAEGALVAFPTETVYGLGADARSGHAVAEIFAAKERPRFNPLIVHVPDLASAEAIGTIEGAARDLAQAFWPGPISLVVPLRSRSGISDLVTAGLDTVAIRVPGSELARDLLSRAGVPVAAPSANPSGRISPTEPTHVLDGLGGRIAAVVDGGPCAVGLESTIVAVGPPPILLRPGGVPEEALAACLGRDLLRDLTPDRVTAPGQLRSHYAPKAAMRLNVTAASAGEVHLGFGTVEGDMTLSPSGDLTEAAARLFGCLRALDATGRPIAVAPIPNTGLGLAINDRLSRAAAPKS